MKKFTSLFALLAGLCVISAQASVTVHILSTNPSNHHLYWYNSKTDSPSSFGNSPTISTIGTETDDNGFTLFTKTFELAENCNQIGIVLFTGAGNDDNKKTNDIMLDDNTEYYINYNGDKNYSKNEYFEFDFFIAGSFYNDWTTQSLIPVGNGRWMQTINFPEDWENVQFKFVDPSNNWYGYDQMFGSNDPYSFVFRYNGTYNGDPSDNNIILNPIPNIGTYTLVYEFVGPYYSSCNLSIYGNVLSLCTNADGVNDLEFDCSYDLSNFKVGNAYYERACTNQWGTLCLPFKVDPVNQNGVKFYNFSSISGEGDNQVLNLTPIVDPIQPGMPVVFKLDNKGDNLYISEGELSDEFVLPSVELRNTPIETQFDYHPLYGSFKNFEINSGVYFISGDQFWYGSQGVDIKPYRAWFSGSSSSAPIRIEAADTEGLKFVEQENGTVKAYYDLQGRKFSERKGLMIENGKIIMVK